MTNIKIELLLESKVLQGKGLDLEIFSNKSLIWNQGNITAKTTKIILREQLPLIIEFKVSGKTTDDTQMDSDGNIINDKFLRITHLAINDVWIKKWVLEQKIFYSDFGNSNYFGNNGSYFFQIASNDIFDFWLDTMLVD